MYVKCISSNMCNVRPKCFYPVSVWALGWRGLHHLNNYHSINDYKMTRLNYIPNLISYQTFHFKNITSVLYSWCDASSFFFGIGKKFVFKLPMNNATQYQCITCMGNTADYDSFPYIEISNAFQLRTEKVMKNKPVKPRRLPPTDDSLQLHLLRCVLQIQITKNTLGAGIYTPTT